MIFDFSFSTQTVIYSQAAFRISPANLGTPRGWYLYQRHGRTTYLVLELQYGIRHGWQVKKKLMLYLYLDDFENTATMVQTRTCQNHGTVCST